MQPLFHARTKLQIDTFLKQPSHGMLLIGEAGIGKYFVATWLAAQLSSETITLVPPEDKTTITIEQIRELYAITKTGSSLTIIIKDAQNMGIEAQNAFLKLLEEPPKNTAFILTANSPSDVLQTIRSRCQHIEIIRPETADIIKHTATMQTAVDSATQKAFLHSSNGLPGTFFTLLTNEDTASVHTQLLSEAKSFYTSSTYERHLLCTTHTYQKDWALQLLAVLSIIVKTLLRQSSGDAKSRNKVIAQAELLQEVTTAIQRYNANVKIQLTKLVEGL